MKKCPKCGKMVVSSDSVCSNCSWDFTEQQNPDEALVETLNDEYEYMVLSVTDDDDGYSNLNRISSLINEYASERWRLHTIYSNEIGKQDPPSLGAFAMGRYHLGLNSMKKVMICETIIVLERRKKKASN